MYGADALPMIEVDSSFSMRMTKTCVKVGTGGGVGVGAEVGVGAGVGVGVGVGVAVWVGFGLWVGRAPGALGDGLAKARDVANSTSAATAAATDRTSDRLAPLCCTS